MPPRVVLVTGVARWLGAQVAAALAADPARWQVVGVDTAPPGPAQAERLAAVRVLRGDPAGRDWPRLLVGVDAVVHVAVPASAAEGHGRGAAADAAVVGGMRLFAAAGQQDRVRRVVVRSATAVYGSTPRDPAVFVEAEQPRAAPRRGPARDALDVEGYARSLARRRPDLAVSLLRLAPVVGPRFETPLAGYLAGQLVPTLAGLDPRLQLLHEQDAVAVLAAAAGLDLPPVLNVAGEGVVTLSQALRRSGRLPLPVTSALFAAAGRPGAGPVADRLAIARPGPVADTRLLREQAGLPPVRSTAAAFADFAAARLPAADATDRLARLGGEVWSGLRRWAGD